MGKQKESKYIECPFFHYYEGSKISCEGVESGAAIHLVFHSPDERRAYQKSICSLKHKNCVLAQALYDKWK